MRLGTTLPLNTRNLAKFAKASDPWSSSIAIDTDPKGDWIIWGLVDQFIHVSRFIYYESTSGGQVPGVFNILIEDVGEIAVFQDYALLGRLRHDSIIEREEDVLHHGVVHDKLLPGIQRFHDVVREDVGNELFNSQEFWPMMLEEFWCSTIARILNGAQRYRHGATFLISLPSQELNVKHIVKYDRLPKALRGLARHRILWRAAWDQDVKTRADSAKLAKSLRHEIIEERKAQDFADELGGSIKFVAALSQIDGLVALSPDLEVFGFGVEIRSLQEPETIVVVSDSTRQRVQQSIRVTDFGTRHRSVFRFCSSNPASVGFVISQDGVMRAITHNGGKVIMWENLKTHLLMDHSQVVEEMSLKKEWRMRKQGASSASAS